MAPIFDIKNMRQLSTGKLKATFTVAFQKLELNDCRLMEGRSGLFFSPPSRSYEKNGETKYANYFYITDEALKLEIEEAALAIYEKLNGGERKQAQETRTAPEQGGNRGQSEQQQYSADDDIPF